MAKRPRVVVTRESETGRNLSFRDTRTGWTMNRADSVRSIEAGWYQDYHVRKVNGVKTPVSNPDRSESNNLE
jgi:hypothetical protein